MKIVDKLIEKVGWDKMVHFLVGALMTSWASMIGVWAMIISVVFVGAVSYLKERLDDSFCKEDIIAGMLGSVTSCMVFFFFHNVLG